MILYSRSILRSVARSTGNPILLGAQQAAAWRTAHMAVPQVTPFIAVPHVSVSPYVPISPYPTTSTNKLVDVQTIANVGQMHKAAKAGLKDVKTELAAGGWWVCSYSNLHDNVRLMQYNMLSGPAR